MDFIAFPHAIVLDVDFHFGSLPRFSPLFDCLTAFAGYGVTWDGALVQASPLG